MYEEIKSIDRVEILENGTLQVRQVTIIKKDGVEIAKYYHRYSFCPGADIHEMPQNVQDIATVAWTPEVISAYQATLVESNF